MLDLLCFLLICRAAQGFNGINASKIIDKTWSQNPVMIFFGESKTGRSSPSAFEISLVMVEKPLKPCKIQKNIIKSCIYRFIAADDVWGKRGCWMESSNGQD